MVDDSAQTEDHWRSNDEEENRTASENLHVAPMSHFIHCWTAGDQDRGTDPGLAQPVEERPERGGRTSQHVYRQVEVEMHRHSLHALSGSSACQAAPGSLLPFGSHSSIGLPSALPPAATARRRRLRGSE